MVELQLLHDSFYEHAIERLCARWHTPPSTDEECESERERLNIATSGIAVASSTLLAHRPFAELPLFEHRSVENQNPAWTDN
jgi:hypothetical protein